MGIIFSPDARISIHIYTIFCSSYRNEKAYFFVLVSTEGRRKMHSLKDDAHAIVNQENGADIIVQGEKRLLMKTYIQDKSKKK